MFFSKMHFSCIFEFYDNNIFFRNEELYCETNIGEKSLKS